MRHRIKKILFVVILIAIPLLALCGSVFCGRFQVYPKEVVECLLQSFGLLDHEVRREAYAVVMQLRLPRTIAAAAVGAGLAVSGGAFQGVFRNPLVNSGLLGVSNGAGFGAALAIVVFGSRGSTYMLAFVFGIVAVAFSYWIARIYKTVPTVMLILGGTIVSSVFGALITLLKSVADVENELPAIVYWLMGSVSSVSYEDFWTLIPIAIGCGLLLLYSWKMNVLSMGEKEAQTMGVSVVRGKFMIILAATLATAGAVCLSGIVGWIGLVIPHIARMLVGNDNRKMLPVAISVGAAFMILIDTISRSIASTEVPLGVLTAIVGAPFFVFLLKKTKGGGWQG